MRPKPRHWLSAVTACVVALCLSVVALLVYARGLPRQHSTASRTDALLPSAAAQDRERSTWIGTR